MRLRSRRVEPQRHRRQQRRESRLVLVVLGLIVVVTGLVIAAWRFGGTESPTVDGLEARTTASVAKPAVAQKVKLEVRAVGGSSYVEVWRVPPMRTALGRQLYAGTLEKGQVQRFTDTRMYLSVRRPDRVVVKINGVRYAAFDGELSISAATAVHG